MLTVEQAHRVAAIVFAAHLYILIHLSREYGSLPGGIFFFPQKPTQEPTCSYEEWEQEKVLVLV